MTKRNMLFSVAIFAVSCRNIELPENVTFLTSGSASNAGIQINLSGGTTTTESGGSTTFAVSLNTKPSANVTLTLASDNTAEGQIKQTAGVCITTGTIGTSSCTLTFTDATWLNPQNVQVVGQNDNSADGNVAYKINFTATSTDTDYNGKTAAANLTNNDNDTAGFTATPASGLVTKNNGTTVTSQIRLSSQPNADVTFSVKSDNTAGGDVTTPASKSFNFTNANWNTAQNLVVTGGATAPLDYKILIDGVVTSADPNYGGITGTTLHTGIGLKNISGNDRIIFFTSGASNGNMGGATGADARCNIAGNKPNGSSYKAIIGGGGRTACTTANCSGGPGEHSDWVLFPNVKYLQSDGTTVIGTTTANAIFAFPLTNAVGGSSSPWSGLTVNWTNGANCSNWASTSGDGYVGITGSTTSTMLDGGFGGGSGLPCSSLYPLYCAEQ